MSKTIMFTDGENEITPEMLDKVSVKMMDTWRENVKQVKTPKLHLIGEILDNTEGLCGPEYIELAEFIVKLDNFIQDPVWRSKY